MLTSLSTGNAIGSDLTNNAESVMFEESLNGLRIGVASRGDVDDLVKEQASAARL